MRLVNPFLERIVAIAGTTVGLVGHVIPGTELDVRIAHVKTVFVP